jgi:hypothetical protein
MVTARPLRGGARHPVRASPLGTVACGQPGKLSLSFHTYMTRQQPKC